MARLLLGFGALVLARLVLSWRSCDDLERVGTWFVTTLGPAGMALGALLADGFHSPVPLDSTFSPASPVASVGNCRAAAGLLPISYWFVCSVAGLLRLPCRAALVLAIVRAPRLVISYALIDLVWSTSPP